MASIETYLWSLVAAYEPTAAQKLAAGNSHNNLRNLLNSGQMAARIRRSFLSGSYARDTAIRPIDDVDVVFEIDISQWPAPLGYSAARPEQVLESFANAIRYRYAVSSVYGQRRSVRLEMHHLDIDVVPAIPKPSAAGFVWIPDKSENKWIISAPEIHSQIATQVNQATGGRLKPLVKLLKAWNNTLPASTVFKSFAIETVCTRLFRSIGLPSLEVGALSFFDFIAYVGAKHAHYRWNDSFGVQLGFHGAVVPDTAGTGTNVVEGLEPSRRAAFVDHAARKRDLLLQIHSVASSSAAAAMARQLIG